MPRKTADTAITNLRPGDRVLCDDEWSGTVVRVVDNFLGRFAVVDHDSDFIGQQVVYAPYIRLI